MYDIINKMSKEILSEYRMYGYIHKKFFKKTGKPKVLKLS